MAGFFRRIYDWLLRLFWYALSSHAVACPTVECAPSCLVPICVLDAACRYREPRCEKLTTLVRTSRATEMDITMIGLQNAGKTSLLRVLAVSAVRIGKPSVHHHGGHRCAVARAC